MSGDDLVVVGRVGKSHGLDGSFVVEEASEAEERFRIGAQLIVENQPAQIVAARRARGRPVIRLDRRVPRGAVLEVPRDSLTPPGEDEYYVFQLVGLRVEREDGSPLGTVSDVSPGLANDVLELDSGLFLPMVEDCILDVDLAAGRMVIARGFADAS